ncbi:hypothetical protein ACEWY4_017026 [Coilia grayii]|uniref:PI-PLC X domain-containing protein 1-like n=1 Tax=Coilia grayii TaxID=363190 RepID=A0ABD1JM22_9TELE
MEKVDLPDWMSQLPCELTTVPLWDLAIPGDHDSMTYCLDSSSTLEPNTAQWIRNLQRMLPRAVNSIVKQWTTTQERTIIEQLDGGVRYFDLRIACKLKDVTHTLYFAHALYTTVTVEETFTQVVQWLAQHPREVIILACSTFDGLVSRDHQKFIAQLTRLFSNTLCPKMVTPSLQLCWEHKYQVILSYAHPEASSQQELWPKIDYWWTKHDRTSARGVIEYLENRLQSEGRDVALFVAGLNLTANWRYLIMHLFSSVKKITLAAYPELLEWVLQQRCGSDKTCINIIAADFVGVNEFVQLVININHTFLKFRDS